MSTAFLIAVSNGEAVMPDQIQESTCIYCPNNSTDTFMGELVCKVHLYTRELAEGL